MNSMISHGNRTKQSVRQFLCEVGHVLFDLTSIEINQLANNPKIPNSSLMTRSSLSALIKHIK